MPFFTDIDTITILERNHTKVEGIELKEARKLQKIYQRAKLELKMQLLSSTDNTFTEAKLKSALLQVEQILNHINYRLRNEARFGFDLMADSGIEDSVREVNAFEKHFRGVNSSIPFEEILESTKRENFLFNNYQTSIDSYSANLRAKFQSKLTQSLIQKKTWSQAVWDMEQVFNGEEWILARIVRTELHNIYNVSKMGGFLEVRDQYMPNLKKTLYHPMDSRTGDDSQKAARLKLIVDIDKPFQYSFKEEVRTFMAPPDRPNDRAILIPYRKEWA
jgi:hypothetical protein